MKGILYFTLVLGLLLTDMADANPSSAKSAIEEAAKKGHYLMLTFYKTDDLLFKAQSSVKEKFRSSSPKKVAIYDAILSEPINQGIAAQYGIGEGNELPLVLVIAPNGAITGGFSKTVTVEELKKSISASELMIKVLKLLQEQKIVLVALQNKSTKYNTDSWKGVNDFTNDSQYGKIVGALKADPSTADSKDFIKQCGMLAPPTEATVVILLPPGKIAKIISGKTTKESIIAYLEACKGGSCGSGGCSDRRFKQNITPIVSAINMISKLQGVRFTWNRAAFPNRDFSEGTQIGLVAQDVESVIPEVVQTDFEGYKSISYDKLTAVLIEAIKEMQKQMNVQDSLINVQRLAIEALEKTK